MRNPLLQGGIRVSQHVTQRAVQRVAPENGIACRQDTVVRDPFYEEVPKFFGMSLKELYSAKHPAAWVEFERGEISEEILVSKFFRDSRAFNSEGMKLAMVSPSLCMPTMQRNSKVPSSVQSCV